MTNLNEKEDKLSNEDSGKNSSVVEFEAFLISLFIIIGLGYLLIKYIIDYKLY